jgi:outer membrane protein, multidrug efflux system
MIKEKIMKTKLIVVVISALLAGCAVGPDFKTPTPVTNEKFINSAAIYNAGEVDKAFWRRFNDPTLNQLIDDAAKANHDLKIAIANVAEAKSLSREARSALSPTILANTSYRESLDSLNVVKGAPNPTRADRESRAAIASIDMSWELDFAGRLRRGAEAANAEAAAVEARLDDVQITLAAEVARNYFELREQQLELMLAKQNVENFTNVLKITEAKFGAGSVNGLDRARAKSLLDTARATVPQAEAAVVRTIYRLSVLTGKAPGALNNLLEPKASLTRVEIITAIGTPEQLLKRRPDIRAAERELAAATARIGIAIADFYPRITIGGEYGVNARSPRDWDQSGNRFWSIGPSIKWAFLDSGAIRARVNQAEARVDAAMAKFDKTVLVALEETENALFAYSQSLTREKALNDSKTAATDAAKLAQLRFDAGASDFLVVLDAERTRIAAERDLAQGTASTATSLVAVYKALAGGF